MTKASKRPKIQRIKFFITLDIESPNWIIVNTSGKFHGDLRDDVKKDLRFFYASIDQW